MSAKAAKVLGAHAQIEEATGSRLSNVHDIDFSDVALAPGEGPPPIPLRSSSGALSAAGIGSQSSNIHSGSPHSIQRASDFSNFSMIDGYGGPHLRSNTDEGQLSLDPPLQHNSRHQEISPFLFQEQDHQGDDQSPGRVDPMQRLARADAASTSGFSGPPAFQSERHAAAAYSLFGRPTTPPFSHSSHALASSASQVSLASGASGSLTPGQTRRSKNPLKFFKKKSVPTLREGEASPSSTPRMSGNGNGGIFVHPSGSYGSRADLRENGSAMGLDEELNVGDLDGGTYSGTGGGSVARESRKGKLIGRPRTRDKDSKKMRTFGPGGPSTSAASVGLDAERGATGLGLSAHRPSAATSNNTSSIGRSSASHEVPLALDTNFDQIDDIVDTSMRQSSLVGPMNETLSPQTSQIFHEASSGVPRSPVSPRSGRDRSTSVSFLEQQRATANATTSLDSPQRPHALRRLATATGSNFPSHRPILQQPRADISDPRFQKLTRAEAQAMLASRTPITFAQQDPSSEASNDTHRHTRDANVVRDRSESVTLAPSGMYDDISNDRKASYASTSSRMTNGSDISPTTSVSNVARSANAGSRPKTVDRRPSGQGVDAAYRFPPHGHNADPRKSSASSAKVISSWMAPDSWAVQEGKMRDALRDEDDEANEGNEAEVDYFTSLADPSTILPSSRRETGRPSMTSSVLTTEASLVSAPHQASVGSFESGLHTPIGAGSLVRDSLLQSRRETVDSSISNGSVGMDREANQSKSYDSPALEILEAELHHPSQHMQQQPIRSMQHTASFSTSTTSTASMRPSSRGGSSIGHVAAAAVGKLGLHRPTRIKINNSSSRPNTAGSVPPTNTFAAIAAQNKGLPSTPGGERPKTIHVRIYKDDGTHAVISITPDHTAADLRERIKGKDTARTDPNKKPKENVGEQRLFVRDKGSERPLGESEKPGILQRRRMKQAGYTDADNLDEAGHEDMRYLLKFVYRPDRVTNFDSYSFGNTEADFNVLDLRNRNLEMVPIFLYRHAEWIKSLDLSGNPMHDIPLDFIQLCSNLSTLCLSHLSLKRIPQSIRQAVRLTHLDISDNRIPELAHISLNDIPQLMSLKAQNNRLFELPSYFGKMQFLRDLNISNNRFEVFPLIVCQLSNLRQLDISFNTIAELPDQLSDLDNLQRLVLVGNSLVNLPASMSKISSLQAIDVRRNLLQGISALFDLPRLEELKCEHNSIKHLDAMISARLKTLEIGQNPLSKATIQAHEMCSLTVLNLSSSNMGKLEDRILSQLPNLTELVLDHNNLTMLPDNLGQLSKLTLLSCTNNILTTLPDSLGQLGELIELLVHNNNLKSLPASVWYCDKLQNINVSSNLLDTFPLPSDAAPSSATGAAESQANSVILAPPESRKASASSLGPLPGNGSRTLLPLSLCLTKLRLGDNNLTEDIFEVLSKLPELQILNLSCNDLYDIPAEYGLEHLSKLHELYLSGNSLGSIPADALPVLRELRILHVNGNKLQTLPKELGQLQNLVNLDVGNNMLKYNVSNQEYDWNWNSNPGLRYLNLSGNTRLGISGHPVATGENGVKMGKSYGSDFQELRNMRVLGLMDVTNTKDRVPEDSSKCRVRTTDGQLSSMGYGISDALGQHDHLSIIDRVIVDKRQNESIFALFAGRGHGDKAGNRAVHSIARLLPHYLRYEVAKVHQGVQSKWPDYGAVEDVLRRAFLRAQKELATEMLLEAWQEQMDARAKESRSKTGRGKMAVKTDAPSSALELVSFKPEWRSGCSGILAWVINQTLFIANCGDALAVLSRNSSAHLVSTKHEPFDRNETLRIRSAEGWVSLQGQVNDTLNVSRSFGHFHLAPIVNAAPAVHRAELTDSDEFLIIANSTLWDFVSYQTAVDIARMHRHHPNLAAQKLRDFAISYGAEDSIMVMVVTVSDLFTKSRNISRSLGLGNAPTGSVVAPSMNVGDTSLSMGEPSWDVKKAPFRRGRDLPGDRTLARLEREVPPPVGQVALVFTDIRNSTSLWETNAGMHSAIRLHNLLLRRQLRNIGGYEVKTEGDAFMVSFQTVTSALLWCFQVQIQLLKENWPQEILESEDGRPIYDAQTGEVLYRGLSVRMGIHWGWPVCEADPITRRMDYFGPMVNRASRIEGAAEGGQIMVSRDVIAELRAIMSTFDSERRRTLIGMDGSGNNSNNSTPDRAATPDETPDEEALRLLNPNVARDAILLRRMGFVISDAGERRLKGLETPEQLSLVYPKSLTGRLATGGAGVVADAPLKAAISNGSTVGEASGALGTVVTEKIAPVEVFEPTVHLLNVDEVKMVSYLCLRLEALAQGSLFDGIEATMEAERALAASALNKRASVSRAVSVDSVSDGTTIAGDRMSREGTTSLLSGQDGMQMTVEPTTAAPITLLSSSRQMTVESHLNEHPELLLAGLRDDATDEELYAVMHAVTGRIWVALSSLAVRKFVNEQQQRSGATVNKLGLDLDIVQIVDMLQAIGRGG